MTTGSPVYFDSSASKFRYGADVEIPQVDVAADSGVLSENTAWSDVPSKSVTGLNTQANALQQRTNWIRANQPVVVTNVSALRALDKTKIGYAVTKGYYTAGDGGSGEYWYDSSDTTSTDNGITTLVASDGGRWKLPIKGELNARLAGAVGDGTTDDTLKLQAFFKYIEVAVRTAKISGGRYLVSNLSLGDPATSSNRSASNQGQGIYNLIGEDRERSTFVAKTGTTGTLLQRNNLSGITIEKIGIDGQGIVDTCLDLSWSGGAPSSAPSVESVFRDIFVTGGKITGINMGQMHDCTIDSIKSIGSPIALSLIGGGGQLNLTNCNFDGIVNSSSQNLSVKNTVCLKGFSIQGSADNTVNFDGCQIFPIASNSNIPSYKAGNSIDAQDASGYGCNVSAVASYFFGTGNCVAGVFDSGATFDNCVFQWGSSSAFFGTITQGRSGRRPKFVFKNCQFRSAVSPYGTSSAVYDWEMHNCVLYDGTIVQRAGNRIAGTWTPTFAGSTTVGASSYTVQSGQYRVEGNVCFAFFDLQISSITSAMAGIILLQGLPFYPSSSSAGGGAASITLLSGVVLDSGYTCLSAYTTPGQLSAVISEQGSGKSVTPLPVANVTAGSRISGCIIYAI